MTYKRLHRLTLSLLATLAAIVVLSVCQFTATAQPPRSVWTPPQSQWNAAQNQTVPAAMADSHREDRATAPPQELPRTASRWTSPQTVRFLPSVMQDPAPAPPATTTPGPGAEASVTDELPVNEPKSLTRSELEFELQQVKDSTELDDAAKAALTALYTKALEWLTVASESAVKVAQWKQEIANAPAAIAQAKQVLATPLPESPPVADPEMPLADMDRMTGQLNAQLQQARDELLKAEARLKIRDRKAELVKLTEDTKRQLEDVQKQLSAPAPETESAATTKARRAELQTRQVALEQQVELNQTEQAWSDALSELWTLQRDQLNRRISQLEGYLANWQSVVASRRKSEALREAREALAQLQQSDPALQALMKRTSDLADERAKLADKLATAVSDAEDNRKTLLDLQQRRNTAEAREAAAGLSTTIGLMLLKQREELPDSGPLDARLDYVLRELPTAELRVLDLKEERASLGDLDASIREVLAGIEATVPPAELQRVEPLVREALELQRNSLDSLIRDYDQYVDGLGDLEVTTRMLSEQTDQFAEYIDERVLWIRNMDRIGLATIESGREGIVELATPATWREVAQAGIQFTKNKPWAIAVIVLSGFLVLMFRRWLKRRLRRVLSDTAPANGLKTLRAVLLTFATASLYPWFFWFTGWLCLQSSEIQGTIAALTTAMMATAVLCWPAELIRYVFCSGGLAERHLAWDPDASSSFRGEIHHIIAIIAPLAFATSFFQAFSGGSYASSLGRLAFIAAMIALARWLHRLTRPGRGILDSFFGADEDGWGAHLRRPLWLLSAAAPLAIALLAAEGFNYSAHHLSQRLLAMLWYAAAVLFVRSLIARWMFIKQWNMARRLAEQRAAEAALEAEENEAGEENESTVVNEIAQSAREVLQQEEQASLVMIDIQLRQLLRLGVIFAMGVGIWFIWKDTFPALRALEDIPVWPASQPVATAPAEPAAVAVATEDAAAAVPAVAEAEPAVVTGIQGTSLADLLLTLAIAVATFMAGRSVPGLLEVMLLERLRMQPGARNAVTTICGYAIMLTGLLVGGHAIGLRWQSIQWLAAALTVGLGFGLQEIFANFVSGLILLFERPIRVGDVITLGDVTGTVTKIRIRATTITNWDRKELIVPNKDLVTGRLLNWTLSDHTNRLVINVGVAYGSDTEQVRKLMLQIAEEHPMVMADPAPNVTFESFGDSTLNFVLRCYLASLGERLSTTHDLNSAIHSRFGKAGIEIAFPQQDIHIRSVVGGLFHS